MPVITYHKPFEQRIIDAACIYWDVPVEYFIKCGLKGSCQAVYRRRVLFYLTKENTMYGIKDIGRKYSVSYTQVYKGILEIESQKAVYRQVAEDVREIRNLAYNLEADYVTQIVCLKKMKRRKQSNESVAQIGLF